MTSLITPDDVHYFNEGTHGSLASVLGSHPRTVAGVAGTTFAVWAPNAETVSVIGDFNGWNARAHPLAPRADSGIWEGFVPGVGARQRSTSTTSPRATAATASTRPTRSRSAPRSRRGPPRSCGTLDYDWGDDDWMAGAPRAGTPSTRRSRSTRCTSARGGASPDDPGRRCSATASSRRSSPSYVDRHGLHARRAPAGHGAPVLRLVGLPDDRLLRADQPLRRRRRTSCTSSTTLHQRGIGVILDWVPSHFPTDEHGLAYFDGTHLYEHADPRQGFHPDWSSAIFNYGRNEVRSFLISSALFWLDALPRRRPARRRGRVDALPRLLAPRRASGSRTSTAAARTSRRSSSCAGSTRRVYATHPDVQTIAEESTAWPMVSRPTDVGGLGFGLKWDMGWMHDTLAVHRARSGPPQATTTTS